MIQIRFIVGLIIILALSSLFFLKFFCLEFDSY